jgi:iduronate 2-sulfatase
MKMKLFTSYRLFYHSSLFFLTVSFLLQTQLVQSQVTSRYNVLFIAVDDMNDRCSFLGQPEVKTPNLKRLIAQGMVFTRPYCQYPMCNASRTSVLSGWRPDKTQIFGNSIRPDSLIDPNVVYLPEYFKQFGYHTEDMGKLCTALLRMISNGITRNLPNLLVRMT